MKRTIIALLFLGITNLVIAQTTYKTTPETLLTPSDYNGIFNHFDISFTIGTTGLGFDIATPVTDWVRLRAGGTFRLPKEYRATIDTEVASGLDAAEQDRRFDRLSAMMKSFMGTTPERSIELEGNMKMNNFKFLVDIFPFKDNHHWRATIGFFYGNGTMIDGHNTAFSMNTLAGMSFYNLLYEQALRNEFTDMSALGIDLEPEIKQKIIDRLRNWGKTRDDANNIVYAEYGISIPMGTYTHDIAAQQDIYDKDGNLIHRKGDIIHKTGETIRAVPDKDDMLRCKVRTNAFKPYIGTGYEMYVSKDKRSSISFDAGIIFWGGKPKIDISLPSGFDASGKAVTQTIDLVRDASNIQGEMGEQVNTASSYNVFPELSLRFTRRLW